MKFLKRWSTWPKLTFVTMLLMGILLILLTVLYLGRNTMVIIVHFGDDSIYNEHSYEILNPFRDRQHEVKAEMFFLEFQSRCDKALAAISDDSAHINYTCERESLHPLIGWHLRARKEASPSEMTLRYEVVRYEGKGSSRRISDPFWVRLKKDNNDWRVTNYETWY